ncbi:MAG TPA: hypothetical protein VFS24_08260, partial [Steroidobacteraceae bacterium]|nr:hypothetical protein [Steroidobacteraceae bacterium]
TATHAGFHRQEEAADAKRHSDPLFAIFASVISVRSVEISSLLASVFPMFPAEIFFFPPTDNPQPTTPIVPPGTRSHVNRLRLRNELTRLKRAGIDGDAIHQNGNENALVVSGRHRGVSALRANLSGRIDFSLS